MRIFPCYGSDVETDQRSQPADNPLNSPPKTGVVPPPISVQADDEQLSALSCQQLLKLSEELAEQQKLVQEEIDKRN